MRGQEIILPAELSKFLVSETVCCLAVSLPKGEVHTTPLLYWLDPTTLNVYMATAKASEKMWWYRAGEPSVNASVVIGLAKKLPYLLQMRGALEVFDYTSESYIAEQYFKRSSQLDNPRVDKNTMIVFKPYWARYNTWADHKMHTLL